MRGKWQLLTIVIIVALSAVTIIRAILEFD